MPAFRQQPLTWLFFIATACLDAIALATNNESVFADSLVLGQLFIASGWLVLGRSHRLVRAAIFVTAIGMLTTPDYVIARLRSRHYVDLLWPHVLAVLMLLGLATVMATLWWLAMARLTSRGFSAFRRADWQFPVAEIFGWMIIVAVASLAVQRADFSLINGPRDVALGLATTTLAGAIMALTLGNYNEGRRVRGRMAAVLAAGIVTLNVVVLAMALPGDVQAVIVGSLVYAACWSIVLRLDRRAVESQTSDQDLNDRLSLAP